MPNGPAFPPVLTRLAAAALMGACAAMPAAAETGYPSRAIQVISSQAAGGGVDALLRTIANVFQQRTNQAMVIDPRPGANGLLAVNACANARPDGYTVCLVNTQFVIIPSIEAKPPYNVKDFAPVTHISTASLAFEVNNSVAAKTIPELVAYSKANPGKLNYVALGQANPVDMGMVALMKQFEVDWTAIQYRGANDSMLAMARNEVQIMFITSPNVIASVKAGAGHVLFVTGEKRVTEMPDVPTLSELGYANPNVTGIWFGLIAPAGTPKEIRDKLAKEISEILKAPEIRNRAAEIGAELVGNTPEEFGRFIAAEQVRGVALFKDQQKSN
ncbi:tripartite tricarboxylate transporter substrate binding protein [Aquabacter sp. CN5-332]|uniref:Bug family tripartite tricarboxylate transporter substrate binding protein n=1 Tax=Aquabacter sp. CN5-332 TaxID=3156608 RepID=UPI0032B54838